MTIARNTLAISWNMKYFNCLIEWNIFMEAFHVFLRWQDLKLKLFHGSAQWVSAEDSRIIFTNFMLYLEKTWRRFGSRFCKELLKWIKFTHYVLSKNLLFLNWNLKKVSWFPFHEHQYSLIYTYTQELSWFILYSLH